MDVSTLPKSSATEMNFSFIPHQRFLATQCSLVRSVSRARPGDFVWLIAPSWSGKSELRRRLLPELGGSPQHWPTGHLPLISVRAVLNQGDKFNPKDFALRLHQEITEPDTSWTSAIETGGDPDQTYAAAEQRASSVFWREVRARKAERELRLSFERMSRIRGLKYIVIEEAANICRVPKSQSSRNYMLGIMALIEEIGSVAIMIGTHEASTLYEDSQEVFNRSDILYMRPYGLNDDDDLRSYASLIKAIGKGLPLSNSSLLQENLELIALNGGGVFGPTLRYMMRANEERCRSGAKTIGLKHLQAASGTDRNHRLLWGEIEAFNRLADGKRSLRLADFLNIKGSSPSEGDL